MKEILIPLNFTTTPTVYDTKQSFSTSDEASGVLTFTTTADVAGTVASLTIRNASENANRQTVLIERLDINRSPFSYTFKNPLPFGQYEGTVLLKKNLTVIASATFLFGVNSSLSAEVLPDLVKAYALDELVENVETEVSNLKDAFNLTVSETVKGVNKTESSLQAQENVRYLNEHQRKANELERIANENARIAAELERKDTFDTLVDSEVIEQTVVQEVAEKYQEIEALNAPEMVSFRQQLEQTQSQFNQAVGAVTEDSEVILARNEYTTLKERLDAEWDNVNAQLAEKVQNLKIKNEIVNGDFSQGTTGWVAPSATLTSLTGELEYTVNALQSTTSYIGQGVQKYANHVYYGRFEIKPKYGNNTHILINEGWVGSTPTNPDVYNVISGVYKTSVDGLANSTTLRYRHDTNTLYAIGDKIYYKNMMLVDLTDAFGEGNEPTKLEMDELMKVIPNGWWDGELLLTQKQYMTWLLNLQRKNTNAIIALGGTII